MQSIQANGYPIHFGANGYEFLSQHLAEHKYSSVFVIADSHSHTHCVPAFLSQLATEIPVEIIEIEPGENFKNIETCLGVWNALTDLGADRKSLIINVGGGVVTDLGGFVASTFKRGIDCIQVPTTLLAMVDASVGGKNGVDLGSLKNQIGVISVPKMVLIDTSYLETLPQRQMRSGLAEMLKLGLICDKKYWEEFLDLSAVDFADFDPLIYRSVELKNGIVMQDPTENGIRKALNFGHTLGHAIESYFLENPNKTPLLHGEAIAAGMILESHLSLQKGLLSPAEYAQIKYVVSDIFGILEIGQDDIKPICELLIHDKKNEYGSVQFALIESIGKIKIDQKVDNKQLLTAFTDYKS